MATNNDINIVVKAIDKATKPLKGISKGFKWLKNTIDKNKESIKNLSIWIAAAWTATVVAWKQFFDLADSIETTMWKADIVFGEYIDDVKEIADETAKSMWLSKNEYLKAASGLQDLLIPMGFAREEATKMTTDTIALAWALAEWSNWQYDAAQAGEILAKAFLWETEQLKSMGISIQTGSDEFKDLQASIMATTWASEQQSKALAIQQLIMEKSTDAQRAFAEWADSLTRKKAELTASIKNARDSIAIALIPAFHELINTLLPVIENIAKSTQEWAENKENIEKLKDWIITTIKVFKTIGKIISTVIKIIHWFGEILWEIAFDIYNFVNTTIEWFKRLWKAIYTISWSIWRNVKESFSRIKTIVSEIFWEMIWDAKEWWENLITMFIDWLKQKVTDLKDSITEIAGTISDYLWFHSPTKKGPNSDSDKWMPNLIDMLSKWLREGEWKMKESTERVANQISEGFSDIDKEWLKEMIEEIQLNIISMSSSISSSIGEQRDKIKWLMDDYRDLKSELSNINEEIWGLESEKRNAVAERAIEIEDEILKIKEKIKNESEKLEENEKRNLRDKINLLNAELEIAKANTNEVAMQEVRAELAKTEVEKIIDRKNLKIQEAEEEKVRIQELIELKKNELLQEAESYKKNIQLKKDLDAEYFQIFWERMQKQRTEIEKTTDSMRRLLEMQKRSSSSSNSWIDWERALWGTVQTWKTYLVWENGPELFSPSTTWKIASNWSFGWSGSVNINIWDVIVQNEADENRLIEKIEESLTRTLQLQKMGIS